MARIKLLLAVAVVLPLTACTIVTPGTVKDINNYWLSDNCEIGKACPETPEDCDSRTGDSKQACLKFVAEQQKKQSQ